MLRPLLGAPVSAVLALTTVSTIYLRAFFFPAAASPPRPHQAQLLASRRPR